MDLILRMTEMFLKLYIVLVGNVLKTFLIVSLWTMYHRIKLAGKWRMWNQLCSLYMENLGCVLPSTSNINLVPSTHPKHWMNGKSEVRFHWQLLIHDIFLLILFPGGGISVFSHIFLEWTTISNLLIFAADWEIFLSSGKKLTIELKQVDKPVYTAVTKSAVKKNSVPQNHRLIIRNLSFKVKLIWVSWSPPQNISRWANRQGMRSLSPSTW